MCGESRVRWTLTEGAVLGGYRVIRPLGRGGMGEVYEAEHEVLGKRYALKLVLPELTRRPGFVESFRPEARVTAELAHSNVLHLDDFREEAGHFLVRMELMEGVDAAKCVEGFFNDKYGELETHKCWDKELACCSVCAAILRR